MTLGIDDIYLLLVVAVALAYHVGFDVIHKNKTKRIERFLKSKFSDYINGDK